MILLAGAAFPRSASDAASVPNTITFHLKPNPAVVNCLAQHPGNPALAPTATVVVHRGKLTDTLIINVANIRPELDFDLFTVEHSSLTSSGAADPNFKGFGLAWYQSDIQVDSDGKGNASIKTILLDEIFGFDAAIKLLPTNTFHVGFWFNNPADAAACGFTGFTPFNGELHAGPLAMISVPDAATTLGPLCTKPNTSTVPATCNP
ncbi:MAG TPA: hypothetical protein VLR94_05570 [Acidobacteriota bacterium]|nr:hypothetical protein [Acidobacteriota bacterium]